MTTHRNSAPPKKKAKKKSWWQITLIILAILIGVAGLCLAGFEGGRKLGMWGESDDVRYLRQDPLAGIELSGLKLEYAEQSRDQGLFLKQGSVHVARLFVPSNRQSYDEALVDLVNYAKQNGWVYFEDALNIDPVEEYGFDLKTSWWGIKTSPHSSTMEVTIKIVEPHDMDYVYDNTERSIWIYLSYYTAPTITCNGGGECNEASD